MAATMAEPATAAARRKHRAQTAPKRRFYLLESNEAPKKDERAPVCRPGARSNRPHAKDMTMAPRTPSTGAPKRASERLKNKRVAISKAVRFEVFKRDKFTCQYCGAKAPDVVLECDHLQPVASGGDNDPMNLVTSCHACNNGKRDKRLSETTILDKQRAQLEELSQRREQLEMLIMWRDGIQSAKSDALEAVCTIIGGRSNYIPSDSGRKKLSRWLKSYGESAIIEAVDEAFDAYEDGSEESWRIAFAKIPTFARIAKEKSERPYLGRILYIQGIIRKRIRASHFNIVDYLEHLVRNGADIDEMERRAKKMDRRSDFEDPYDQWLQKIGAPF
jgi:5-methylcytosine-specific restriction endonuclease McrA